MGDERIFNGRDYGVEIFRRGDRFFMRYDAGEISSDYREDEITADEVEKVMRSEEDAYRVFLACERRAKARESS